MDLTLAKLQLAGASIHTALVVLILSGDLKWAAAWPAGWAVWFSGGFLLTVLRPVMRTTLTVTRGRKAA